MSEKTYQAWLLTLLIFNSATGTRSSRKIMARCEQDLACRVIVGEDTPDFRALREFRRPIEVSSNHQPARTVGPDLPV